MKLSEKIIYYRKRAGMNQEALADQLGVSRQAVSKWETGEAVPELNKVVQLAKLFHVTTDELLLDDAEEEAPEPAPAPASQSSWVEAVPGVLGRILRRYGWLAGVYMAVSGAFFTLMGALATGISNSMMNSASQSFGDMLGDFVGQTVYINGELVHTSSSMVTRFNPVGMVGGVIIVIGVIMMIGGTALAVILKKKGKNA